MSSIAASAGPERANRWLLIVGVGLALITGVLVFAAVANFSSDDSSSSGVDSGDVKVLVAKDTIKAGTALDADMFRVATFSENNAIADPLDDAEAIIGQTTTSEILKGQQLSSANLVKASDDPRTKQLTFKLPPGYHAVGAQVDKVSTFGGLVVPGDRVDVLVTYDEKDGDGSDAPKFKRVSTVLQNVLVVAREQNEVQQVNTLPTTPAAGADGNNDGSITNDERFQQRPEDLDTEDAVSVVTLALTPEDVQKFVMADALGEVTLVLRKYGEDSIAPLEDIRTRVFD